MCVGQKVIFLEYMLFTNAYIVNHCLYKQSAFSPKVVRKNSKQNHLVAVNEGMCTVVGLLGHFRLSS